MARSIAKNARSDEPVVKETCAKEPVKKTIDKVKNETVAKKTQAKKTREYHAEDTIPCVSLTHGQLVMSGAKSGLFYTWENFGDITYVEYQDLYAIKTRHSDFIYSPLFMIDDEELLSQPRWADVAEFYENMYTYQDIDQILNLDNASFRNVISNAPKGLRRAIEVEMITRLENGSFDSLQKIKIVDEICGTDLKCYIS